MENSRMTVVLERKGQNTKKSTVKAWGDAAVKKFHTTDPRVELTI